MYEITIKNGDKETKIHSPYFNDLKLLSGSIKHGINVASNFSFSLLPNNPSYNLINPLRTLVAVENMQTGKMEFDGFIFMPNESMDEAGAFGKSFTAISELGYLKQSAQRHGEYHDITVRDFLQVMIDNHNRDISVDAIDKQFKLGIVDVDSSTGTLYRYLGYENTLDTIKDKLLDRLGGELRVRKENGVRYLDYMQSIGELKETEIRLAKNLKSITKEVDPTDLITRLIPLGERIESEDEDATDASEARITIESVNNGLDYIIDKETEKAIGTVIVGTHTWDDITQPGILKTSGEQHLRENNRIKKQHDITALDLSILKMDPDSYEVGNWHPVINQVMGIDEDLRIVGKTIDIINPENNVLKIGDQFKKASDYQRESNKSQAKIVDLESSAVRQERRIKEQSKAVKQAQEEIVRMQKILDNADLENIEEVLLQINNQLGSLFDNVGDVGLEIIALQDIVSDLETFRAAQEQINYNQADKNQEFEDRLLALENPEEGDV